MFLIPVKKSFVFYNIFIEKKIIETIIKELLNDFFGIPKYICSYVYYENDKSLTINYWKTI